MDMLVSFAKDESGATAIEYGLIAAAMAALLILSMPLLTKALKGLFDKIIAGLATVQVVK